MKHGVKRIQKSMKPIDLPGMRTEVSTIKKIKNKAFDTENTGIKLVYALYS